MEITLLIVNIYQEHQEISGISRSCRHPVKECKTYFIATIQVNLYSISQQSQLTTEGFCWSKVLLPTSSYFDTIQL